MERGHLIAGTACLILLILVIQGTIAGSIDRSVVQVNDTTYRVMLQIPGETVAGITETLSGGMECTGVSLATGQYQIDGTTLSMAIIGEPEVSYLVRVKPGEAGEIRGTYRDMLTGEEGTLPGAGISGLGSVEITPADGDTIPPADDARPRPTPLEPGILVLALCAWGLLFTFRRAMR